MVCMASRRGEVNEGAPGACWSKRPEAEEDKGGVECRECGSKCVDGDSNNRGELGDNDQSCVLQPLAEEGDEYPVGNGGADSQENGHVGVLG